MPSRTIKAVYPAETMNEGVGVTVHRPIGKKGLMNLDPFLLLDEFEFAPNTGAGFPNHPHRGFETMTYMLSGAIKHTDTVGNSGTIRAGDAQWMTAGSGIIHSEMPTDEEGPIHGLQLWINLPSTLKMTTPKYRDAAANKIPVLEKDGYTVRIIAGEFNNIKGPISDAANNPLYMDITLSGNTEVSIPLRKRHTTFLYILNGNLTTGNQHIKARDLALLNEGDNVHLTGSNHTRLLLISGQKLHEPIARYGPFVMNTHEEILTAIDDYNHGRFPQQSLR